MGLYPLERGGSLVRRPAHLADLETATVRWRLTSCSIVRGLAVYLYIQQAGIRGGAKVYEPPSLDGPCIILGYFCWHRIHGKDVLP